MMLANTTTNNSNSNPVSTTSKSSISSLLSSSSPSASPPPSPATMKTTTNLLTLPASFTANSLSTALAATTTTGSNTNPSFSDDPTTALLMLKESLQKHSPAFSKLPTSKSDSVLSSTEVIDLSSRSSYHTPSKTSGGVGTNSTSASPSPRSSPSPAVFTTTVSSTSRSISPSNTMTLNVPKRLLFESAGTYGLQRNVPFLLRNSTIWRPGALPTPTNINPATGTIFSQFEYVRMNFPTSMCSVEEVTKRNRNTRAPHPATARATMGSPSSPAMMRPGAHASVIDMKVECKVFVVKDGIREKDPANEVKDVFVVREHPQKMVRRGEELQISVRFHKLPSDFISSSREFVFSIRMYRINVNNSSPLSPNKLHQQDEEFLFESDIILHSKSRTKPGQSAKEAAAEREANRIMAQQQVAAATAAGSGSPMTSSMHNLSISSPKVGSSNWRSTSLSPDSSSPSPNASPSRIVIPSATKLSSSSVPLPSSPTFDAASLVYNLQRSSSGSPSTRYSSASHASNSSAPLLGDLCEEADRVSKRARISSLLNTSSDSLPANSIASDTRTAEEVEESRKHWVKFLQQVGIEQPEKAASILVKEKIEISQLASLRFEVLRALGFLVGDILRMIDHSATYLKENPTLANASVNQISNQISSIHLNRSNSSINTLINSSSGLPNSISPSPCASPRTSYETNEGSTKHRQVSRNAKDEIEDGVDEDSGDLQIDDDDNGKEESMTPAAKVSNEDRKDKESLTSEYSGDEAEEVENEKKRRRPSAFHLHPSREQMEIFDVQEALIKLSNSPPPNRFQPIRTQAAIVKSSLGRSALTSSSSALPTVNSTPNATTTSSSSSSTIAASLPSSKVSTQLRETIKLVQRFADKMVSKISNVNNLDQELAERSREMANVVSHLEACLALSSPPAKPYTLEEIEAVSQRISNSNNQKGLNCSSDSVDSPRLSSVALRSSANQIHNNNSSCSDNESTDGDYDLDEGDSDTENLDAFQPLAYYVGVIKAHLELRKSDASRKSSGLKRDVLKKEYVLVPIEEASRVLGISTTKLSRAYKSTSILSRCGWVFKGRKRRLRWPTRPLRVLLKYICEKYLCEMANSYVSLEADKQQQQQRLPRSHSLDHLLI